MANPGIKAQDNMSRYYYQKLPLFHEASNKNVILGKSKIKGMETIVSNSMIAITVSNNFLPIIDNISDISLLIENVSNVRDLDMQKYGGSSQFIPPSINKSPISTIDNTSDTFLENVSVSDVQELSIPTYDGSGQCVHPSVRYIQGGWAGYEWWMAFTPYPKGDATYENPSLVASHDGIHWIVPAGLTNPIDPTPPHGHNADTELIYDGKNMLVYYIDMTRDTKKIHAIQCHRRVVYPNMSVGAEETCINFYPLSPAIVRKSADDWLAWYCNLTSLQLCYATSRDGLSWTDSKIVPVDMQKQNMVPWHISVLPEDNISVLRANKGYLFLIAAYHKPKDNNGHTRLYLGYATDLNSSIKTALILPPEPGWTEREVYRSCMVGSRIYISAADNNCQWHIGYGNMSSGLRGTDLWIWRLIFGGNTVSSPRILPKCPTSSDSHNSSLHEKCHSKP